MDTEFLSILVCPICKGKLIHEPDQQRFVCRAERLAFPISEDGIPVLLAEEAVATEESTSAGVNSDNSRKNND